MYKHLTDFLAALTNPPADLGKLLSERKYAVGRKGYGTPELEMQFLHKVFLLIGADHPEFISFGWEQTNSYNDEYYHFNLLDFEVNDKLDIDSDITFFFEYYEGEEVLSKVSFDSVTYPDPEEIAFGQERGFETNERGLTQNHWEDWWAYREEKYKHLQNPCLKMLAVLKLLEINFSMYYFLYTFGNGVKVRFDKEGVQVTKQDASEIDGQPLGEGMHLSDL